MNFTPTAEKLIPDMSTREELVLLARCLWSEGYSDHLAGHITYNLGDGTLLCNPWLITWNELRPEQVIRIDLEGNLVEGDWPVPLGIPLHLQLHKLRHDVKWAMHNHPLYGTVWSDMGEIPPIYDQSSALGGGKLVLVDEYDGPVNDPTTARAADSLNKTVNGSPGNVTEQPVPPARQASARATASPPSERSWPACSRPRPAAVTSTRASRCSAAKSTSGGRPPR